MATETAEIRIVRWEDACGGGDGWRPIEEMAGVRPSMITTVGFVLSESDTHVTLVQSMTDVDDDGDQRADHVIAIPKSAIR